MHLLRRSTTLGHVEKVKSVIRLRSPGDSKEGEFNGHVEKVKSVIRLRSPGDSKEGEFNEGSSCEGHVNLLQYNYSSSRKENSESEDLTWEPEVILDED